MQNLKDFITLLRRDLREAETVLNGIISNDKSLFGFHLRVPTSRLSKDLALDLKNSFYTDFIFLFHKRSRIAFEIFVPVTSINSPMSRKTNIILKYSFVPSQSLTQLLALVNVLSRSLSSSTSRIGRIYSILPKSHTEIIVPYSSGSPRAIVSYNKDVYKAGGQLEPDQLNKLKSEVRLIASMLRSLGIPVTMDPIINRGTLTFNEGSNSISLNFNNFLFRLRFFFRTFNTDILNIEKISTEEEFNNKVHEYTSDIKDVEDEEESEDFFSEKEGIRSQDEEIPEEKEEVAGEGDQSTSEKEVANKIEVEYTGGGEIGEGSTNRFTFKNLVFIKNESGKWYIEGLENIIDYLSSREGNSLSAILPSSLDVFNIKDFRNIFSNSINNGSIYVYCNLLHTLTIEFVADQLKENASIDTIYFDQGNTSVVKAKIEFIPSLLELANYLKERKAGVNK